MSSETGKGRRQRRGRGWVERLRQKLTVERLRQKLTAELTEGTEGQDEEHGHPRSTELRSAGKGGPVRDWLFVAK